MMCEQKELRDWFACKALAVLVPMYKFERLLELDPEKAPAVIAKIAYQLADAMMAERNPKERA